MLEITVELVSARGRHRDKRQARIEIANVGGTETRANYRYRIFGKGAQKLHEGTLTDIPRKKALAIDLLGLALVDARGEKWLKL